MVEVTSVTCFLPRRSSPEGQSFRSLADETPTEFKKKQNPAKDRGGNESEEDYENVRETEAT